MSVKRYSSEYKRWQPFVIEDIRRILGGSSGGIVAGSGGAMIAHALNGPYHTGELDPDQATWAVTDTEFLAHTADPDAHHARATAGPGIGVGGIGGQVVSLLNGTAQYQVLVTGADPFAPSYNLLSSFAGAGLGFTGGQFVVNAGVMISTSGDAVNLANGSAQYQIPVTQATPFAPAYMGLSSFAGNGLAFTGGQFAVGAGAGITVNSTNVALTTPGGLDVATANSSTGNHTHAIAASAAPGVASALLKTDASGLLTLAQLAIGSAMTLFNTNNVATGPDIQFAQAALLAAADSLYLNVDSTNTGGGALIIGKGTATSAATELARITNSGMLSVLDRVRTPLLDTASGTDMTIAPNGDLYLSPTGNDVVVAQAAALRSDNFLKTILIAGFRIGPTSVAGQTGVQAGSGEFDELRARIFVADETRVDRGQLFLTKSYGVLSRSFTVPASVGGTASLYIENSPNIAGAVFSNNDWVMLSWLDMSGGIILTKVWGQVSGYTVAGLTGEQRWTFTLRSGTGGLEFAKGSLGVDFGGPTQGYYILMDAVTATAPNIIIGVWNNNPYTPANHSTLTAMGRLDAVTFTGEYGLAASVSGYGVDAPWIKVGTSGAQLNNLPLTLTSGGVVKGYIGAWNDIWFGTGTADRRLSWNGTTFAIKGQVTAETGYIGSETNGWTIDANSITANGIRLYALRGTTDASRIELGDYTNVATGLLPVIGLRGVSAANVVAATIAQWAGRNFANRASAPYRLTYGGTLYALDAVLQGSLTAANGEALLDTSGLAIVSYPGATANYDTNSLRFLSAVGGSRIAALSHSISTGTTTTLLSLANTPAANYKSNMMLLSTGNNGDATLTAQAVRGAKSATVLLSAVAAQSSIGIVADVLTVTVPTVSFSGAVTFGGQPVISADGTIDGAWFFKSRGSSPSALASYLPVWFDGSLLKARLPDGTIKTIQWV